MVVRTMTFPGTPCARRLRAPLLGLAACLGLIACGSQPHAPIQIGGGVPITCSNDVGDGTDSGADSVDGATSLDGAVGAACSCAIAATKPKLVTSGPDAYWREATWTELDPGPADLTVDESTTYQTWSGFGGAFNEVGWDVLSLLAPGERDCAMRLLFDANAGAGFVHGRVPIGASDFALDRYTLDETPGDYAMADFSIARDKRLLIPYVKTALAIRPDLHLWASPWTPPGWMKDNGATDGGNMKGDPDTLRAFALYLARFVEDYAREGLTIEAVHPQNEPNYASRYPSCIWTPDLFATFIGSYLGPTFVARNVPAQIYLGTMSNGDGGKDNSIVDRVTADARAMSYVKGFGMQWHMQSRVPGLIPLGLPIVQTEHKCGNYPWQESTFSKDQAPNNHAYALETWGLIRDWIKAGVNAYSAWNMVLDSVGYNLDGTHWPQNALLTVDRSTRTLTATPAYYVFRHLSQYVQVGATRVATVGNADALAFENPDRSVVAVIHNPGDLAQTTTLGVAGTRLQIQVPALGWATAHWP
jgi:glucosylceramidase